MKKFTTLFILLCLIATSALAQNTISGTIIDRDTKDGVMQATVALLKKDSTFVKGVISDTNGKFSISAPAKGNYILKITSVAYKPLFKTVSISESKSVNLGSITLEADAIMLKEAIATGQAARVTVKEDTFVYNAAAYHTPEGAVIEELVKRLPGAQVDDDGKIKINGKEVKKILVDGKEFMTGDTETALKNLPTDIVDKIKAYDQKSDLSRITGIDDGEEETVLDFGIKRGMNKGTMGNFDLSVGTHNRYSERGMLSYMKDDLRIMGMGSANNTGDMGFPGGGGGPRFGGGGNGLNSSKMFGFNVNYEKKDVLKLDGSLRWNHRDGDTWSRVSSENFLADQKSYGNSISKAFSRSNNINFQMRLEWTPDSMTNIMFRPRISTSHSDNARSSENATFNDDPFNYVTEPLTDINSAILSGNLQSSELISLQKLVNYQLSNSLSYSTNDQYSAMFQYNRKFNKTGRNITFQGNASYRTGESISNSLKDIFTQNLMAGVMDTTITNRYETTPTKTYNYSGRFTYSEPIAKSMYLQASYQFTYNKQKSDRSTYDYSDHIFDASYLGLPDYRDWNHYIGGVTLVKDEDLSKFSEYDTYTHQAQLQLRKIGQKWNYTVGIMFQPQNSEMKYKYQGLDTIVKRSVFNFAPSLDLRYKISKISQLRINYNSQTSQPSMTDLLEVFDDADPLHINTGNAGLKPSFTQNMRLFYNGYDQWHSASWMTFLNFNVTQNSVSQKVTYFNETTTVGGHTYLPGSQLTRPENINGNWGANAGFMFNCSIDSVGYWNINTFTNINYNNRVAFYNRDTKTEDANGNRIYEELINTTRTTGIMERLGFSYRNSWIEVEPNGNLNYNHTRNLLQSQNNLDTWSFNYGMNISITAPWGTGFSTDAHMNSRRGYSDSNLNTNEFVWNAQISQSFLKGRPLTVMLQFYDILKNQSTFSRAISATQRTDSEYNSINSYAMLHVVYRFNNFGGKGSHRGGPDGRPDFSDPRFSRGGQGGPPAGGFGGRPGGFGGRPGGFGGGGHM